LLRSKVIPDLEIPPATRQKTNLEIRVDCHDTVAIHADTLFDGLRIDIESQSSKAVLPLADQKESVNQLMTFLSSGFPN
jgi:hypothetical protein